MSSWCGTVAVDAGVALQLSCSSRVPWAGLTVAAIAKVAANSARASGPRHEHRWHCSGGFCPVQPCGASGCRPQAAGLWVVGLRRTYHIRGQQRNTVLVVLVVPVGLLAGLLAPCWLCFGCIGLGHLSCWLACWLACLLRAGRNGLGLLSCWWLLLLLQYDYEYDYDYDSYDFKLSSTQACYHRPRSGTRRPRGLPSSMSSRILRRQGSMNLDGHRSPAFACWDHHALLDAHVVQV